MIKKSKVINGVDPRINVMFDKLTSKNGVNLANVVTQYVKDNYKPKYYNYRLRFDTTPATVCVNEKSF